ncbi:hypothetical protein [Candidatus Mycobacterium methanotrophicum]|uniref:Uncharacterized protein n=1 Tax=Candidatus Mycobacterium methanotrophicum TaxID=2943498 RepID=A0ABY4QSL4_9MYCO|nr:hypothetical protein [Candidatus Mycobacterium methanotrophicum]UQX13357.1 hypothetical protein M5I08_13625 [Candidatus Mycobacterium methanotrophicum]
MATTDRLIVTGGADGPLQATVFVCIISVRMNAGLPGERPATASGSWAW